MIMIGDGRLSSRAAKDLFIHVIEGKGEPEAVAEKEGLLQTNTASDIEPIVAKIIVEHATVVADYKAGKEAALQFLIGQAMKASKGSANPAQLKEIFIAQIN